MTFWVSRNPPLFIFERLAILWTWIGHPSEILWQFKFLESLRCSFSRVSIFHGNHTYTRVKSYGRLNFPRAYLFNFERLDILWVWIGHPSEKLWPFEFLESFRCSFSGSRYMMGLTHTPESKVMAVLIFRELTCSISSVSIYYAPESEIRVKCYDQLNFSIASVVHFRASRYIIVLTHAPESKVLAVWICRELPLIIF